MVYIPARQLLGQQLTRNLDSNPQRFPCEDMRSKLIPSEQPTSDRHETSIATSSIQIALPVSVDWMLKQENVADHRGDTPLNPCHITWSLLRIVVDC